MRFSPKLHRSANLGCRFTVILFARIFGVVRARDVHSELFDLNYTACGDLEAWNHVEERLDALVRWLAKQDCAGVLQILRDQGKARRR